MGLGMWVALDLINNYCRVFGGPRLEISCIYFLGQKKYDKDQVFFTTNLVSFTAGVFLATILLFNLEFLKDLFFKGIDINLMIVCLILLNLPLLFLRRNYYYFLLSMEDTRSYNNMMILQELISPFVSIILLFVFKLGLWSMLFGMLCSSVISSLYGFIKVHRMRKFRFAFSYPLLKEMLQYSSKIYFSEAIGFLNGYLTNLLTAIFLSPISLAFLSMGKGKAEWLSRITNAVSTVLYPRISNLQGKGENPVTITGFAYRVSFIILVATSLAISVFIYPAILFLYGKQFLPIIGPFFIIIPSFLFYSGALVLRQYFLGIGRADVSMKISITPLILQVLLCYFLLPIKGYIGGAIAVSVSYLLTFIVTIMVYKRFSGETYFSLLIPKKMDFSFIYELFKERLTVLIILIKEIFKREKIILEDNSNEI